MATNNESDRPDDQEYLYVRTDDLRSHPANARADQGDDEDAIRVSIDIASYQGDRHCIAEIALGVADVSYEPNFTITIRPVDSEAFASAMAKVQESIAALGHAAGEAAREFQSLAVNVDGVSALYEDFTRPKACLGCRDYNGFISGRGEKLVCGIHPMGPVSSKRCPDHRTIEIDLS